MSKSKKKAIYKEGTSSSHIIYRRNIRRIIKQYIRDLKYKDLDTYELPNPKNIIQDWDWSDYTCGMYQHFRYFPWMSGSYFEQLEQHRQWLDKLTRK